jgi:hypothetical protein
MSWTDDDYRPWLRRWVDHFFDRLVGWFDNLSTGIYEGVLSVLEWPGRALSDWWTRFQQVDGWFLLANFLMGIPALAAIAGSVFVGFSSLGIRPLVTLHRYDREAKRPPPKINEPR